MKVSLNGLVQLLAAEAGQPFSVPLQRQLKVVLNYKRADWMQKIVDAHPEQRKYFIKYITIDLVDVDQAECPAVGGDCTVKKTVKKIPTPTRSTYALFDYVGDNDRTDSYGYATIDQIVWFNKYNKYTSSRPKYEYANGYVYVYNEDTLEQVTIGGIWPDQAQLNEFKCDDQPCYTDDDQYDIADDIINTMIQDVLKNEFRLLAPELAEVTVDESGQNA
jgi:hypothetical protein